MKLTVGHKVSSLAATAGILIVALVGAVQYGFLAVTKVLAVALGHVVGVVAAHDRAIKLLPRRHQLTGQLPLLVAMVGFTVGGLYLLFAA